MTVPSVEIQGVADALATLLEGIDLWVPRDEQQQNAWAPKDLDSTPAGVVELPTVRQAEPGEVEDAPLGFNAWVLEFNVTIYAELTEANYTQSQLVAFLEALISAINVDRSLGNVADDARMVTAEVTLIEDQTRPMMAYECQVVVLKIVADPDP